MTWACIRYTKLSFQKGNQKHRHKREINIRHCTCSPCCKCFLSWEETSSACKIIYKQEVLWNEPLGTKRRNFHIKGVNLVYLNSNNGVLIFVINSIESQCPFSELEIISSMCQAGNSLSFHKSYIPFWTWLNQSLTEYEIKMNDNLSRVKESLFSQALVTKNDHTKHSWRTWRIVATFDNCLVFFK